MSYAICRSYVDALVHPGTGKPYIQQYKGYTIDPQVGQYGGIIVDTQEDALHLMGPNEAPNRIGWLTMPIDDPAAELRRPGLWRQAEEEHANVRLAQCIAEAADPDSELGRKLKVIQTQCERLLRIIEDERLTMKARVEAKLTAAGRLPTATGQQAQAVPAADAPTPQLTAMERYRLLQDRVRELRALGGPEPPKLNSKKAVLEQYIELAKATVGA